MNGYIAELGDKECEELLRLSHQSMLYHQMPLGLLTLASWKRGGQVLEKLVSAIPSFTYFQIEKYLEG